MQTTPSSRPEPRARAARRPSEQPADFRDHAPSEYPVDFRDHGERPARRRTKKRPKRATQRAFPAQAAAFLEALEQQRVSPHTVRGYRSDLAQLLDWLRDEGLTALNLDRAVCRRYVAELTASEAAPATIARKVTSLRAYIAFLSEAGVIDAGAADGLKTPRRSRNLPDVLSTAEAERLLAFAADFRSGFQGESQGESQGDFPAEIRSEIRPEIPGGICQRTRDLALLELLYSCGLRSAEACTLRVQDVRRDEGILIVHGKGNKTRIVPLFKVTLEAIEDWLAARPQAKSEALFTSINGRRLSTADIRRIVAAAGRRVGVEVHPHQWRHTCATHLLNHGADLRAIQELLGHSSIRTTERYTRVSEEHLKAVCNSAHPRA